MKKYIFVILSFVFVPIIYAAEQSEVLITENRELVSSQLQAHTYEVESQGNVAALLDRLSYRVLQGEAEILGFDPVLDGQTIDALASMDLNKIQKEAMKPAMDELCRLIDSGRASLREAGELLMEASEAETNAMIGTYENLISGMRDEIYNEIVDLRNREFPSQIKQKVDWAALTVEVPKFAENTFRRACSNHKNPTENPAVETIEISGSVEQRGNGTISTQIQPN